ncbi:MAG: hypothetical protein A3H96_05485 [Acidobacteria bacterium RIFCSPLOWO2_02_FULL_67_36]|nr:MAG: hypothetical protein A3H96_05485 [Acidobacteria bacterium RIFCSPLOWO2_02_FULL_67_36]OFW21693.1 MAG: hypothetical protein A3G21_14970 [Acidobacteria bacterium RIFCSPLOWO2_12_FULL_66_21]
MPLRHAQGKPVFDGSLARKLDFGDITLRDAEGGSGIGRPLRQAQGSRAGLRLALPSLVLRGPDKYKALDRRRRQAQIHARHALGLLDLVDGK